jgi:hypothetical protein
VVQINSDTLRDIVERNPLVFVQRELGDTGVRAFRELSKALCDIYRHVEPEHISSRLIVFRCVEGQTCPLNSAGSVSITDVATLSQQIGGGEVLEITATGTFRFWRGISVDVGGLARVAVVYSIESHVEFIHAGGNRCGIEKLGNYTSAYATPCFSELRQALEQYKSRSARMTSCRILSEVWYEPARLFFKKKPEATMRNSLVQYLDNFMRGVEVRPEQNMDDSHPVDIKVTYQFTNRLAVIEIKWLGKSKKPNGDAATAYSAERARDGAGQLADYLDQNRVSAPVHVSRGYLIVFDGRRRNLNENSTSTNRADGMHYENEEIEYDPQYDQTRVDFDPPIRMFMEPICQG